MTISKNRSMGASSFGTRYPLWYSIGAGSHSRLHYSRNVQEVLDILWGIPTGHPPQKTPEYQWGYLQYLLGVLLDADGGS